MSSQLHSCHSIRAAALAMVLALPTAASAVERHWNVASGAWGISTNWSPTGLPGPADHAIVSYSSSGAGTATVATNVGTVGSILVNGDNTARINNAGSLATGGDLVIGRDNFGGTFNVVNNNPFQTYFGRLNVGGDIRIGQRSGFGTFNHNAGTVAVSGIVRVGDSTMSGSPFLGTGTYNLGGSGVLTAQRIEIGLYHESTSGNVLGTFNMTGGTVNVGIVRVYRGTLNQSGGTLHVSSNLISMGGPGGAATFNFSGGTLSVPGIGMQFLGNPRINYLGGNLSTGNLHIAAGMVNVAPGGDRVLRVADLGFTQGDSGVIDLHDNAMVVEVPLGETMRSMIFRAYNNGSWNGNGIGSSTAAAVAATPGIPRTGIGFGHAGELGFTSYAGQSVAPLDIIVRYTLIGDADLNGTVALADFNRLAANFGDTDRRWSQGDFNYDGVVSLHDFNLFAGNFGLAASGAQVTPGDWAALAAVVPEPNVVTAGIVLTWLFPARRRRARSHPTPGTCPAPARFVAFRIRITRANASLCATLNGVVKLAKSS